MQTKLTRLESVELYKKVLQSDDPASMRSFCLQDLFFLLFVICKRADINKDWTYDRCREVEANPDGYIDLWAREHYKSSIITFGLNIQDVLNDPETTIGIFSHTNPISKAFLAQIKRELESNTLLKGLFPDILYQNPHKESPCWSLDKGIIVKRRGNPKECTIESSGLVDGQPTSKHYKILVYDDVVTKDSVTTPEQIHKTTEAWALSLNLASKENCRIRYIGTLYHANDTYRTIIDRKAAIPRIHPATDDGTVSGTPVFISQESLDEKRMSMGSYIFSTQMLLNPLADSVMGFKQDWLNYYNNLKNLEGWNFYIICDPASEKKKMNDYTVFVVIGLAPDGNYYLVDGIRDRINLTERTNKLFELVRKWVPLNVGYEKYGMQSDIEHIEYVQEQENYRFKITALGGQTPKNDRIRRLVPIFENNKFFLPRRLLFVTQEGKMADFIQVFISNEYLDFPVSTHDDMLDAISRIVDKELEAKFPVKKESVVETLGLKQVEFDPLSLKKQPYEDTYNPLSPLTATSGKEVKTGSWRDFQKV